MADLASVRIKAAAALAEIDAAIAAGGGTSGGGGTTGGGTTPPPSLPIISRTVTRPKAAIMGALVPGTNANWLTIGFDDAGRYQRFQKPVEMYGGTPAKPNVIGPTGTIKVICEAADPRIPFSGTFGADFTAVVSFALMPADVPAPVASIPVLGTASSFQVNVDLTVLAEGWYRVTSTAPPGWGCLDYFVYVRQNAVAQPQALTPVITASWTHMHTSRLSYTMVPAQFVPTVVPLQPRAYPDIPVISSMSQLAYTMIVPFRLDDIYRPSVLPSGVWTTANIQNYDFSSYMTQYPRWIVLDGPRGRGNLACPTALRESDRPTGGKVQFVDPWRVGTISDDGTVHTDAGYIHGDNPPPYPFHDPFFAQRPPTIPTLIGDWSAIPLARRGFRELWDLAVDARTTGLDQNAPPIGGEQPHSGSGVVKYVTDTQNNRVCKLAFSPTDRSVPCKVTEFITGLNSPWGCEIVGNVLYVTESVGNRLGAYDLDNSGALLWSVSMVRPEGIRHMDGFHYIGSLGDHCVWKFNISTRTAIKFCNAGTLEGSTAPDGNARFVNVAVSDGSFGPRGSVAVVTWTNANAGWPMVYGPNGVRLPIADASIPISGSVSPKGMPMLGAMSYASCVSIAHGRMTWGHVQDGLHRLSAALPTDQTVAAIVKAGYQRWYDLDLRQPYGDLGFGLYGLALPWGQYGVEVDAMLVAVGHTKPGP